MNGSYYVTGTVIEELISYLARVDDIGDLTFGRIPWGLWTCGDLGPGMS